MCKGLFIVLHVVCLLIEGQIVYVYVYEYIKYNYKSLNNDKRSYLNGGIHESYTFSLKHEDVIV